MVETCLQVKNQKKVKKSCLKEDKRIFRNVKTGAGVLG
jgi:hypothetical protein